MQVDPSADSQLVFGVDVENLRGRSLSVPASKFIGYPLRSLRDVPARESIARTHAEAAPNRADLTSVRCSCSNSAGGGPQSRSQLSTRNV
jgi:hypothetical protein